VTITVSVNVPFEVDDFSEADQERFNKETEEAVKNLVGWNAYFYFNYDERATEPYFIIERDGQVDSDRYDYSEASGWIPEESESEEENGEV